MTQFREGAGERFAVVCQGGQVDGGAGVRFGISDVAEVVVDRPARAMDAAAQGGIVAGVSECTVDVVWEPPWTKDMMSETAKLTLGMF